jgi:Flp pilus assembly protein TadG
VSEPTSGVALAHNFNRRSRQRSAERGAEMVEFNLVLIPMMMLIFLSVDIAWAIFAKASLQEAVREGVRFGVTGTPPNGFCLDASIKKVVTAYSGGVLNASNQSAISIAYYSASNTGTNLAGQAGATAGGNILQVSVNGVSLKQLAPLFVSASPLSLSASATDVLESSPNNIPPCE